jgi:peptidoglycan/xylan/chitin deacetylase (PgdA/CDA1 family)
MYHAVASRRGRLAGLYVTPEEFREEVRYLRVHGYHAVTLRQLEEAWAGRGELPARPIVITFDDGYLGQYTYALPELRRAGYVATLFLTVNRLGAKDGLTPAMVREMLAAGWELGSHTLSHPDLTRVPLPWLRREVEGSRQALQGLFRVEVVSFCYPSGRVDARVEEEVRRAGYLVACGTAPGLGDAGEMFALRRIRVSGGDGARGLAAKLRSFATVACTTRSARAQISPP